MSITVRIAHKEDFLGMFKTDYAANITHPFYVIPWKATAPGACQAWVLDRYRHLYETPNPKSTFLVATAGDEIIGYVLYKHPPQEGEVDEWHPSLPEGANVRFYEKVLTEVKKAKKLYDPKGCWGLEGLAVHPNWQRKGVGSMLISKFLESVDADYPKCYVVSSRTGKPLYERFGFKMMGAVSVDLEEFGDYEPYVTFNMQREAV